MIKRSFLIQLFVALLTAHPVFAGIGADEEDTSLGNSITKICQEIKTNYEANRDLAQTCSIFSNQKGEAIYTAACERLIKQFHNKPGEFEDECKKNGVTIQGLINSVGAGAVNEIDKKAIDQNIAYQFTKDTASDSLLPKSVANEVVYPAVITSEMKYCQENADPSDCINLSFMLPFQEIDKISAMSNAVLIQSRDIPIVYSKKACDCFENLSQVLKLNMAENVYSNITFQAHKNQLSTHIEGNLKKKLINELASNLEDTHYEIVNNPKKIYPEKEIQGIQCTDPERYQKEISSACEKTGMDFNLASEKSSQFLDDFEDKKTRGDLATKLDEFSEKVLNKGKSKNGKLMNRNDYDKARHTQAETGVQGKFIESAIHFVNSRPELKKIIEENIAQKGYSPAWAITTLISDTSKPEVKAFLAEFQQKSGSSDFNQDLVKASSKEQDLRKFSIGIIKNAMDFNPSLKSMLSDQKLFIDISKRLDPKVSLVNQLEKSTKDLKSFYQKRCDQFVKRFAEAICTPKEKYLEKIGQQELKKLIDENDSDYPDPNFTDRLMCELKPSAEKDSVFSNIAFEKKDQFRVSEYWLRKKGQSQDAYSKFSQGAASGDSRIVHMIETMTNRSSGGGQDFSPTGIASTNKSDTDVSNLKSSQSSVQAPIQELHAPQSFAYALPHQDSQKREPASVVEEKTVRSVNTGMDKDMLQGMLRQFLNNEREKKSVDNHFQNINDQDYKELQELRDQIAKGKVDLEKLTSQTEQAKIKSLEEKITRLESNKKNQELRDISNENFSEHLGDRNSAATSSQFQSGGFNQGRETGGGFNGGAQSSTGSSMDGAPGVIGGQGSMAARLPGSTEATKTGDGAYSYREASGGDIVVTSSKVLPSGQVRNEDLSAEVIDFVKNQKPDLKTLKKLMSSGLILKLKVLKNGAEVQQEFKVDSEKLTSSARDYLKNQIALQEYKEVKRQHSFASLKFLLGMQMQKAVN